MGVATEAKKVEAKDPHILQPDNKKVLSSFDQEP